MARIRLLEEIKGIGPAGTERAMADGAAAKFVASGKAVALDYTGQPAVQQPKVEPEGKRTDDVDTPALQDPIIDTGTQPRRRRKKSTS